MACDRVKEAAGRTCGSDRGEAHVRARPRQGVGEAHGASDSVKEPPISRAHQDALVWEGLRTRRRRRKRTG